MLPLFVVQFASVDAVLLSDPFVCFTTVHRIVLFKVCAVLATKSHRTKRSSYVRDKVSNRLYFNQVVTIIVVL